MVTDRFTLFDRLNDLKNEAAGFKYRGIELIDASLSPLYLSLLELNNKSHDLGSNNSVLGKLSSLSARIKEKATSVRENIKAAKRVAASSSGYRSSVYLFFPVETTHLRQMMPVLKIMQKEEIDFLVVTNRVLIYDKLVANGFNPVLIAYPQKDQANDLESLFTADGVSELKHLVNKHIGPELSAEYFDRLTGILEHYTVPFIQQLEEILSFVAPVVTIAGYDITLEGRILTLLAKQDNIRTACIQHGSISGEPLDHYHIADQFMLYGEAAKDYLVAHGLSPAKCVVTGAPYLDNKKVDNSVRGKELKKLLRISGQKPYILVALSGPGHSTSWSHFNRIVTGLLKVSRDYPGYQFVAKLHRKDKPDNYRDLVAQVPGHKLQIIEDKKYSHDIFDWLHGCDLLITGTSTVAQEAMLMGVTVMTIDLMNEYHDVDFIDRGCTIHITEEEKIGNAVSAVLEEKGAYAQVQERAKKYAEYFFYKLDGSAARRCVASITGTL